MSKLGACLLLSAALLIPDGLVFAQTGVAPAFSCNAQNTQPGYVREGGVAELLNDIYVVCTGGTPVPAGEMVPQSNIQLSLNVPITSRVFGSNLSEALLIIDDAYPSKPNPVTSARNPNGGSPQNLCPDAMNGCTLIATGNPSGTPGGDYDGAGQHYNVFEGVVQRENSISFNGVPLDPSGTSTITFRITNLRADVSQLISPFPLSPVLWVIIVGGVNEVAVTNTTSALDYETEGLTMTQTEPVPVSGTSYTTFSVSLREGFPSAFKTWIDYKIEGPENIPGFAYNTESGLWDTSRAPNGLGEFGLANHGTRLMLRFNGYPPGVKIMAPTVAYLLGDTAQGIQATGALWYMAADETGNSSGGPKAPTSSNVVITADSDGNGWLTYEVMGCDPAITESVKIPLVIESRSAGTVTATFAPLVSSGVSPIPRFATE